METAMLLILITILASPNMAVCDGGWVITQNKAKSVCYHRKNRAKMLKGGKRKSRCAINQDLEIT